MMHILLMRNAHYLQQAKFIKRDDVSQLKSETIGEGKQVPSKAWRCDSLIQREEPESIVLPVGGCNTLL